VFRLRIGREITSRFRKGTVPFSLRENWDSPRLILRPHLSSFQWGGVVLSARRLPVIRLVAGLALIAATCAGPLWGLWAACSPAAEPAQKQAAPSAHQAQVALKQAELYLREGKSAEAEDSLKLVLRSVDAGVLEPTVRWRCVRLLAQVYARTGRNREALDFGLRYQGYLRSLGEDALGTTQEQLRHCE